MDTLRTRPQVERAQSNGLVAQLENPASSVSLEHLCSIWFHQIVEVEIAKPPRLDPPMAVLNRVRGALGHATMNGASAASIAGRPCTYDPPCVFDILFREQWRGDGRHGLPKPWVSAMEVGRNSVTLRLSLFGMACDWACAVRERVIDALRGVEWTQGDVLDDLPVRRCALLTSPSLDLPYAPDAVDLVFDTPMDAAGLDLRINPASVVARLARRIDGLSRWMGVGVDADWLAMAECWNGCAYFCADLQEGVATRGSRRQGRLYANPVVSARWTIAGDLRPIWPLLVLGQTSHIGRGAVSGYGRYHLEDSGR